MTDSWSPHGFEIESVVSDSPADGIDEVRQAVRRGIGTVLVYGGDGTVNSVASAVIGTDVSLGVIPGGSGNGLARHFGIPLDPCAAAEALRHASPRRIDIGMVNDWPFLVTCSVAWDAALAEEFETLPWRGVFSYVLAGIKSYAEYEPQQLKLKIDGTDEVLLDDAILCTAANLSQYGGGASIVPAARSDSGSLELVVVSRRNVPAVVARIGKLFNGTIDNLPEVTSRRFRHLTIRRERPSQIQLDGEVVDAGHRLVIETRPRALKLLVPFG